MTLGGVMREVPRRVIAFLIIRALVYDPDERQVCEVSAITENDVPPDALHLLSGHGEREVSKFVRQYQVMLSLDAVIVPVDAREPRMVFSREARRFTYA